MNTEPNRLLSGIRVLELGSVIAGNFAGILLADMGAEVIKVEPPGGDAARNAQIAPLRGESAIHLHMNRGKKSIAIDLKSEGGRAVFRDLVRVSDACMDNMRPGVMERLGIDFAHLRELNPSIVCVSVSGFGAHGPKRDAPAYDLVIQAMSGHMHITGDPDGPPARVGTPLADIGGGMFACISVLAGLVGRGKAGAGTAVDVAMYDSLVTLLGYDTLLYLNAGIDARRLGTAHAYMVPWQAFEVRDGYVVIAARENKFWQRLCAAIGLPDLVADPRCASNRDRVENREFVVGEVGKALLHKTKAEWMAVFNAHDIPAAPVNDLAGVFEDPHIEARGMVREYDHPTHGRMRYAGSPMQFAGWEPPGEPPPLLSEHAVQILRDTLGYAPGRIDELRGSAAVGLAATADEESTPV